MTTPEQAHEWIKLRFPIGSRVSFPKDVPSPHSALSLNLDMSRLFGSGARPKVLGYYRLSKEPHWGLILDTASHGAHGDYAYLTDWVIKEVIVLEETQAPKLEPIPEPSMAVSSPSQEISWGAALATPIAALLGLAAARKGLSLLTKPTAKVVKTQPDYLEALKER